MKKNIYSRIFKIGLLFLMIIIAGSSCVKSRPGETTFNGLGPTVLIPEGGLQNFALTQYSSLQLIRGYHLVPSQLCSYQCCPVDEVITIAIDPNALGSL